MSNAQVHGVYEASYLPHCSATVRTTSVPNLCPKYLCMTRICLFGSMRAAVTDETAQGGMPTVFMASVPLITGF